MSDEAVYKPSEHDGLKQDGTPDKRMNAEFGGGKVDPHEAGKKGGSVEGSDALHQAQQNEIGDDYKPSEHDGLRQDGQPDRRMKGNN